MLKRIALTLLAFACVATLVYAAVPESTCGVTITYPDSGPTPVSKTAYVTPTKSFSGCAEVDDPRSFTITSATGPGNLNASVSPASGVVSYSGDTVGTYEVIVAYTWSCVCGSMTAKDSFEVTIG